MIAAVTDNLAKQTALAAVRIYLITDSQPKVQPLEEFLRRAIHAGVGMVQLREKHLSDAALLPVARRCAQVCVGSGALFIVNDRPDIALGCGADGVHLGQDDLPVSAVRALLGDGFIIGLSTHNEQQIVAAQSLPLDYIGVGPIHATPTKRGRAAVGLELVRYASMHSHLPFFAIGGIDAHNVAAVKTAGAHGVSVLRYITQTDQPERAVNELLEKLDAAK